MYEINYTVYKIIFSNFRNNNKEKYGLDFVHQRLFSINIHITGVNKLTKYIKNILRCYGI